MYGLFHVDQKVKGAYPSDDGTVPFEVALLFLDSHLTRKPHRLKSNWFNQLEFFNSYASPSPDPVGPSAFLSANQDPAYPVLSR